jgi:4-oxalocrotonate tautomerase
VKTVYVRSLKCPALSARCQANGGAHHRRGVAPRRSDPQSEFRRRIGMPLIQVQVIKDVFNKDQKRQIIKKLTDAMVSIEGENMRGVTWVTIEEVESGDWGIGGNALTTSDVHALAAGKAA